MRNIPKLSELEIEVMAILWKQDRDVTIQEIADEMGDKNVSSSSVSQAMKRLLKKKAVSVKNYRLVSNVYARTFVPEISKEEFIGAEFMNLEEKLSGNTKKNFAGVAVTLLESITDEDLDEKGLEELRDLVEKKLKVVKDMRKEPK